MSARCERSDLLETECAHCRGDVLVAAVDPGDVVVLGTVQAQFGGRCALDARHPIVVADVIGRTDAGWICTACVGAAGVKA